LIELTLCRYAVGAIVERLYERQYRYPKGLFRTLPSLGSTITSVIGETGICPAASGS
jgi:hypothetical protein